MFAARPDKLGVFAPLAALLSLLLVACATAQPQPILFSDDFDAGTSAPNWAVYSHAGDYIANFAFDYSTRGIPPAPNSAGGTTVGLQLLVNCNDAVAAVDAVSVYPLGQSFSGDYTLKFDMWMGYNGGAGGGVGSTQFATAGLNHAASRVVWSGNAASDGLWSAVTGDGGDADDYRVYSGATLLSVAAGGYAAASRNNTAVFYQTFFTVPPFETLGAPGKQWVQAEISQRDDVLQWRLNGRMFTIRLDTSVTAGNIMLGLMDTYSSIANPATDTFVIFDNVRVIGRDCNSNGVADEQDLAGGTSLDCNGTTVPDECEPIGGGDYDADGDVDTDDLVSLADGMAGPGVPATATEPACLPACLAAHDFDADTALDLADFAEIQAAGTPPPFAARAADAATGSQFMAEVAGLSRAAREDRIVEEILGGNVPGFLRTFIPVTVTATIGGTPTQATYYVTPDYLCIGQDADFARIPMTPLIAQPIADALGCLMPTRKMVNDIWSAALVKLAPQPISPTTVDIMLATTHFRHHEMVEQQRAGQPLGLLIAGIKKDVVITPLLLSNPNKVAIYGWHYQSGTPIQPLYLGHEISYVDYSHGIRLVRDKMLVNGVEMSVADVLADPSLCVLLSDEGVVTVPHY